MYLELRNNDGVYLSTFKGQLVDPIFKFLLNEQKLSLTIKTIKGEKDRCRVFINNTEEMIPVANKMVEFIIRWTF